GDASKARQRLGWAPKTTFKELVRRMVDADIAALKAPPRRGDDEDGVAR
ncbi:MAG: GDP-mannose 4,6-dehydratase, partial [Armatimonadota bacterium]|nr:GDP-mannose 4,6-dehydratase [Armatimonadota bacterium]